MGIQKNSIWWNNGFKNARAMECPGEGFVRGRLTFKRRPHSDETKRKMSEAATGKPAWNAGIKTGPESEETRRKKSISAKGNTNGFKIGHSPWNKGLTVDTDERVSLYVNAQKGQSRSGNYSTGADHPGWNENKDEYYRYRKEVDILSENNYNSNIDLINPNRYPRGKCGVDGAYQLDHIIPIHYGFVNSIPPEDIAKTENLQMLPWEENLKKSNKI